MDYEFEYNGVRFCTRITDEQSVILRNDLEKRKAFFFDVYSNYLSSQIPPEDSGHAIPSCSRSQEDNNVGITASCSSNLLPQINVERVHSLEQQTPKLVWDTGKTNLLLDIRLNMEHLFNKPTSKKNKLWQKVAVEFNTVGGYTCDFQELYNKYRNLLQTYRTNKIKKCKSGEEVVRWEFFEKIDNVLGNKANIVPPSDTLGGSFIQCSDSENSDNVVKPSSEEKSDNVVKPSSEEKSDNVVKPSSEKKPLHNSDKKEVSLQKYFYFKMKRDEEYKQHKVKKWEERKQLKQQEVDVLRDLVNVMSKNKRKRIDNDSDSD